MNISVSVIGHVSGIEINSIEIKNSCGMEATFITYGATMTRVAFSDNSQNIQNVLLCAEFLELIDPNNYKPKYVGTIGRVANRIGKGKFSHNGHDYSLAVNNGPNHLHGGLEGFDKKMWDFEVLDEPDRAGVRFSYVSPDKEEGYPGRLAVRAIASFFFIICHQCRAMSFRHNLHAHSLSPPAPPLTSYLDR